MRQQPSTWSIIWTDNVCYGITTVAPVVLFLALAIKFTGTIPGGRGKPDVPLDPAVASLVLAGAVALVVFLSAIAALRASRIRRLFDEGRQVEASVLKVKSFRGAKQKLVLAFELHGIPYKVSSVFVRSSKTPRFSEGTRISLLVDPENPKRAVPLALYADPSRTS